jgi:hypothetical protein
MNAASASSKGATLANSRVKGTSEIARGLVLADLREGDVREQ